MIDVVLFVVFKTFFMLPVKTKPRVSFEQLVESMDSAIESMTYPIAGSPWTGRLVSGVICLHVVDRFCAGDK